MISYLSPKEDRKRNVCRLEWPRQNPRNFAIQTLPLQRCEPLLVRPHSTNLPNDKHDDPFDRRNDCNDCRMEDPKHEVRANTRLASGFVLVVEYKREKRVRSNLRYPKNHNNQSDVPFDRNDRAVVVTDPSSS